ncbi:MAG: GNAT family N-acetyltransferase [Geodermatophilaceae bacterium]|nr:GNAT family N-acetyltransferase [Geodermatophilaceae bacterium]
MTPETEPGAASEPALVESGYPPHWEADVVASDGGTAHLRPILTSDAEGLAGLHARSSERTRYLRFFGPYPRIPERELRRFVTVDYQDRVALVIVLGREIIAVGRYDRIEAEDEAEVAFLVEDAHQGRGLGTILLEHLAAAARERGIRRFSAEVLAENGGMVRIFLHAGYTAERSYDQGVVHLQFPIEPTESSRAVAYEREQRSESRSIARLLNPSSVAVVGASNDPAKIGHAVLRNLLDYGFQGPVYPVNPDARHVAGVPAYRSVLDVPDDIDLAVLAVPPKAIADVVDQCRAKQVRGLVVVTGGFGVEDDARTPGELVAAARAQGMRVIGPNCLGIVNTDPAVRLNASLAPRIPGRGRVGFFCQSGALGVAILDSAVSHGLGLSSFVSAGNRADVSGNDLLQFWATDPATEVVLLYLESFGNPRKFARLARRLARTKPVVAVKGGRHTVTGLAAHSVDLPEQSVQALFESSGVIRVETVSQLLDVATLLAHQPLPTGRTVAVVGNSSALGLLVADACAARGLELAGPPVDVGPDGTAADFAAAVRAVIADPSMDALVVVFVPPLVTSGAEVASALSEVTAGWNRPVVTTFLGSEGIPDQLQVRSGSEIGRGSIPSYPSPERAVLALSLAARYAQWRDRRAGEIPDLPGIDADAGRAVLQPVLAEAPQGRTLDDGETTALLAAYGVTLLPSRRAGSRAAALAAADDLGYPVALKSTRRWLRHRTDLGGVRLDLADAAAVAAAYDGLPGDSGEVLIQSMAPAGVATTVGVVDDPSFGALVSFGLAGVATDLLGDRAYRAVPVADVDAAELVRAVRAWPLLDGYRGAARVDVAAIEQLILRVSRLAEDLPDVLRLELEPVIVSASGVTVAGANITVGPATARVGAGPRRLSPPDRRPLLESEAAPST